MYLLAGDKHNNVFPDIGEEGENVEEKQSAKINGL